MNIWRTIPLENFEDKYQASNKGEIRNKKTKYVLKQHDRNGYNAIGLTNGKRHRTINVHILIALAFFGEKENDTHVVNHKNGNRRDNSSANLEYISQKANVKHAFDNNLRKIKTKPVEQYDMKDNFIKMFNSITEASRELGIADNKISLVCKGDIDQVGGYKWKYANDEDDDNVEVDKTVQKAKIEGYEKYYVLADGRIYSIRSHKYLTPKKDPCGYLSVALHQGKTKKDKTNIYIHRLVAQAFIPNPDEKKNVNHINGIKSDNRLENLEWVTDSENMKHYNKVLRK